METDWSKHWKLADSFSWKLWKWIIEHAYRRLLRDVSLNNVNILELGSGSGNNSLSLAKILNAKKMTLVDFNEKALEISKKTFKNSNLDVKHLKRDVLNLKLKEKFDIVHSEGLIEHFYENERLKIIKKHFDLCKKGGLVIIFAPYENTIYKSYRKLYKAFDKWIWDEKPLTKQEIYSISKKLNLRIIKIYSTPLMHEIGILFKN